MAVYVAAAIQTVQPNASVLYSDALSTSGGIMHREGTGQVTLRGAGQQCFARYRVSFCGNLSVPTGGTAGPVSLAMAVDGEILPGTTMTVTPAAVEEPFNVSKTTEIQIPRCCCQSIAVDNITTQAVAVSDANLTVNRIA